MKRNASERIAAVWLPLPDVGQLADPSLARWLYRGDLEALDGPLEPLDALAGLVGATAPAEGRASLRFYGQTGDSPAVWMAGADPVYLEPRLDHLFVHAHLPGALSAAEFRELFDHLQDTLAGDAPFAFARVGAYGYIRSDTPMATSGLSPQAVDQRVPNDYMPTGAAAAHFRQRLSEIEMALHEHPVNERRVGAGAFPVNSLWLWGGGTMPVVAKHDLPPLFCNDPLLLGFWRKAGGPLAPLPVAVAEIIHITEGGFASFIPFAADSAALIEPALEALRAALHGGRLDEVRLHFANDLRVTLRPRHRFRYWRRSSPVPELGRVSP